MQPKKLLSLLLALVLTLGAFVLPGSLPVAQAAASAPRLVVDMTSDNGEIRHGASGFLYGLSNEEVPTSNTLLPLKPQVLATKGALGTEHPYSDAFDVAEQFFRAGGKMLQMYTSNYYAIFGPRPDWDEYAEALKTVICPEVVKWKDAWKTKHGTPDSPKDELGKIDIDKALVYLPINEGSPQVDPETGVSNNDTTMYRAWETYYKAIKEADPNATVGGPNDAAYGHWRPESMRGFLKYCHEHDCWPDVQTWHQLDDGVGAFARYAGEYAEYRAMCKEWNEPEATIVINEYATMEACGVPGILMRYMQMIEENNVYGCLPFWHQANDLNDLTADANEPNSAWWFYKWYADMSGTRKVTSFENTDYHFAGLSTLDSQTGVSSTLFGGLNGSATVVLKDVDKTAAFLGAQKVHVKLQAAYFKGFLGTSEAETVLEGTFALDSGNLVLTLDAMDEATGYNLVVTPAGEDDAVEPPLVAPYHAVYEAEDAARSGATVKQNSSGGYYASGRAYVYDFSENDTLTYTISVPTDGKYRLDFIYGNGVGTNRADEAKHQPVNLNYKLKIDSGTEQDMLLENTMLKDWSDIYPLTLDLSAGVHTVQIRSTQTQAEVLMDALHVTYLGAQGEAAAFRRVYEAEEADFNELLATKATSVRIETTLDGAHGRGYVTGLDGAPVTSGGGLRYTVFVPDSGIYNVSLHYQSNTAATANLHLGNSALFMDGQKHTLSLAASAQWTDATIGLYLEKGLNILDVDASASIALDHLEVKQTAAETSVEVSAASAIPVGAAREDVPYHVNEVEADTESQPGLTVPKIVTKEYKTSKTAQTSTPSGTIYVVGKSLEGSADAASNKDQYLEFTYNAPSAGVYALQLFHSNGEIFGTHSYNTKIIDKYACIEVNGEYAGRYFFINSLSRDTFKEKTVYLALNAGSNTIKLYNDNSWTVKKGLDADQAKALGLSSTSTNDKGEPESWYMDKPGDIPIVNSMPNFSKFILTPAVLSAPGTEGGCNVSIQTSAGGSVRATVNTVAKGDSVTFTAAPQEGFSIVRATLGGKDVTFTENQLTVSNVQDDLELVVVFGSGTADDNENDKTSPIQNNSFGTGNTTGWQIETTGTASVGTQYFDRNSTQHYLKLSGSAAYTASVQQTFTAPKNGLYRLSFSMKNAAYGAAIAQYDSMELLIRVNGKTNVYQVLSPSELYQTIQGDVHIPAANASVCVELRVAAGSGFAVYLDDFTFAPTTVAMHTLAYFVDCGDHDPSTLPTGETFGLYNSVTDQVYGKDAKTGKTWGVYDYLDLTGFTAEGSTGAYTRYSQPEHNGGTADKADKNASYRYADGQDGSQEVADKIGEIYGDYKFELTAGQTYRVEIGLGNNWGNSSPVNVYANYLSEKQLTAAGKTKQSDAYSVLGKEVVIEGGGTKAVSGYVQADTDGVLTLCVRYPLPLSGRTLDLRYIYIWQAESVETARTALQKQVQALRSSTELSALPTAEAGLVQRALDFADGVLADTPLKGNDIVILNNAQTMLKSLSARIALLPDPALAYFVDCGDHGTATLSEGDKFGRYNSCTDQLYGVDSKTGKRWGVVDPYGASSGAGLTGDSGVYTKYTWAHERDKDESDRALDGLPKTTTFRYANSQSENGISPRYITYKFEMDAANGTYPVEVCFGNIWDNSGSPSLYANYGTAAQQLLGTASVAANGHATITGTATAVDGVLTLDVRTEDATINLNYIKIFNNTSPAEPKPITPEQPAPEDAYVSSLLPLLSTIVGQKQLPFADVAKSSWYYESVSRAWENGLIDGVSATQYQPESTLTRAQAIKLAAALHQLLHDGAVSLKNGSPWYRSYVQYAVDNQIIEAAYLNYSQEQMNEPVQRDEFVHIFYGAADTYRTINAVADGGIPDVSAQGRYAGEIYTFYRAGITIGSDAAGSFRPASSIKRSEVAAILIRMFDPSARQQITLP